MQHPCDPNSSQRARWLLSWSWQLGATTILWTLSTDICKAISLFNTWYCHLCGPYSVLIKNRLLYSNLWMKFSVTDFDLLLLRSAGILIPPSNVLTDTGLDFGERVCHTSPATHRLSARGQRHAMWQWTFPPALLTSSTEQSLHWQSHLQGFSAATMISARASICPRFVAICPFLRKTALNTTRFSGCLSLDEQSLQMSHADIEALNRLDGVSSKTLLQSLLPARRWHQGIN